jgi:methylmalonyl-CoA/ethylmalonyl-CoA epimerase
MVSINSLQGVFDDMNDAKIAKLCDHIDQIGIVVRDVDNYIGVLETIFGKGAFNILEGEAVRIFHDGKEAKIKAKVAFAQIGQVEIELIQVISGPAIHTDSLKERGEGIHHLGMYVTDFDAKLEQFKDSGIEVLHLGKGRMRYAYMDTKPFILEIIEKIAE